MPEFVLDWARAARTGTSEAVLCEPKSAAQVEAIVGEARALGRRLLFTRLSPRQHKALSAESRAALHDHPRTRVAIVCAGTSDLPVAREAQRTLAFAGEAATLYADVGVAGLWRLTDRIDEIRAHRVAIAVAGMEGALFSVLAGLVPCAVIAVPTSVGYGVARGGRTALHAALASCSSGLVATNIDNGFGAAHAALRMLGGEQAPDATPPSR